MTFFDAIRTCLIQKYADFNGRASRSEFWYFQLFIFVCMVPIAFFDSKIFDFMFTLNGFPKTWVGSLFYSPLTLFFAVSIAIPAYAVLVRRLHDTNLSGWLSVIFIIPIFGWIAGLILTCRASFDSQNKYDAINLQSSDVKVEVSHVTNFSQSLQIENLEYIEKLHNLKEKGILSDEDFKKQRNRVLGLNEPESTYVRTEIEGLSASELSPAQDSIGAIRCFYDLKESGAITESEFEIAKNRLLAL